MRFIRTATVIAALLAMGSAVLAADATEHQSHHPATVVTAAATPAPNADNATSKMDAKTPEERQALMAEHKKAKHGDTASGNKHDMHGMHGDMMAKHQAMEKRMDMMESMVKLMVERMPAPATK